MSILQVSRFSWDRTKCLQECLPDVATPVTGWFDLRSLLDYGPKTNSSKMEKHCSQLRLPEREDNVIVAKAISK